MTDKELAEKYRREFKELLDEIKEREHRKTIKIVATFRKTEEEKEETEKEYDFVEDYLSKTTDPVLRWYRDYRNKNK